MRATLFVGCVIGTVVFGTLIIASYVAPTFIEHAVDDFVVQRLQSELRKQFEPEDIPSRDTLLAELGSMPEHVREFSVVRGDHLREHIKASPEESEALEAGRRAYDRLRSELIRELRIFAGSNFVLFAFAGWLTAVRRDDTRNLIAPSALLATVTLASGILYLAGEDWASRFLRADYVGHGYFVVVAVVSALLIDVAWCGARIASVIARALWRWPV